MFYYPRARVIAAILVAVAGLLRIDAGAQSAGKTLTVEDIFAHGQLGVVRRRGLRGLRMGCI